MYSHLNYALLTWARSGRTNAAKIECAHRRVRKLLTDSNHKILPFHSLHNFFALLKAFNTNTLNFNKYFKVKLSSHKPFHMHNTRHRTNRNLKLHFLIIQKLKKYYLYQVIPIWNSLPSSLMNCQVYID